MRIELMLSRGRAGGGWRWDLEEAPVTDGLACKSHRPENDLVTGRRRAADWAVMGESPAALSP